MSIFSGMFDGVAETIYLQFSAICLSVPFIITNLVYLGQNASCTTNIMLFPPMPFGIWMIVDTVIRCIMLGLNIFFICMCQCSCLSDFRPSHLAKINLVLAIIQIVWMILGMVTFWGDFFSADKCTNGFDVYIIIYQIVGLLYEISIVLVAIKLIKTSKRG